MTKVKKDEVIITGIVFIHPQKGIVNSVSIDDNYKEIIVEIFIGTVESGGGELFTFKAIKGRGEVSKGRINFDFIQSDYIIEYIYTKFISAKLKAENYDKLAESLAYEWEYEFDNQ